jgi:signal transduction histidine kinase
MIATGEVAGGEAAESARIIGDQADRMTRIIRQLLDFARGRRPEKGKEDLRHLAERTVTMLGPLAKKKGVDLAVDGPVLHAQVDTNQIQQVLTNLVVNGIDATPSGGRVTVHVGGDAAQPRLEVVDTGSGIAPENRGRLFEPFFSTKPAGQGTGLGLAIAQGIVAEHGGDIEVDSEPGAGSTFRVVLPGASP